MLTICSYTQLLSSPEHGGSLGTKACTLQLTNQQFFIWVPLNSFVNAICSCQPVILRFWAPVWEAPLNMDTSVLTQHNCSINLSHFSVSRFPCTALNIQAHGTERSGFFSLNNLNAQHQTGKQAYNWYGKEHKGWAVWVYDECRWLATDTYLTKVEFDSSRQNVYQENLQTYKGQQSDFL